MAMEIKEYVGNVPKDIVEATTNSKKKKAGKKNGGKKGGCKK